MAAALEHILEEALALPDDSKLTLAERLVESVNTHVLPEIEARQTAEVQRRVEEVQSGRVKLIPGETALRDVRDALERARGLAGFTRRRSLSIARRPSAISA